MWTKTLSLLGQSAARTPLFSSASRRVVMRRTTPSLWNSVGAQRGLMMGGTGSTSGGDKPSSGSGVGQDESKTSMQKAEELKRNMQQGQGGSKSGEQKTQQGGGSSGKGGDKEEDDAAQSNSGHPQGKAPHTIDYSK